MIDFKALESKLQGDLLVDKPSRIIYATDASVYRELPAAVAYPKSESDIKVLIEFAKKNALSVIPRAAGTSLAGQVVGDGIVIDVSKYLNSILNFDKKKKQVRVQAGIVRDELNQFLKPSGLFFAPETSTSNRCTIGGMLGNNACGANSLVYGSTREHVVEVKAILSDGTTIIFKDLTKSEFFEKTQLNTLEGKIYRTVYELLSNKEIQKQISDGYPLPEIQRRNTGYALDSLLNTNVFSDADLPFNFCRLLAGSEGTLAFVVEITLSLSELPPPETLLVPAHFNSLKQAFEANLIALKYKPAAVELMDDIILEQALKIPQTAQKAFFVKGKPAAILMVKFSENDKNTALQKAFGMQKEMEHAGYGYHFPHLTGSEIKIAFDLRKAGLGVLSSIAGDAKPVAVIEDTAVRPQDLSSYMVDFQEILKKHELSCVFYAHIATGELHLRPVINLKTEEGKQLFKSIAYETALLVKKYRGSLSGEHGDGRLRAQFIPLVIGEKNYKLLKLVKAAWDFDTVFNPGKITGSKPMNEHLRYFPGQNTPNFKTVFDFSKDLGLLRSAEKCNGSADCRKSHLTGGAMCPSYQASKDEYNSTRARANIIREYLNYGVSANRFDNKELIRVLDLCLSCKACKSECPSGVDISKLKAEILQQYYDANPAGLRSRLIANYHIVNGVGAVFPKLANYVLKNSFFSKLIKKTLGFSQERDLPLLSDFTLKAWIAGSLPYFLPANPQSSFIFFNDEFSNYTEVNTAVNSIKLLCRLAYKPTFVPHLPSGRTYLSKGFLRKAKKTAQKNIDLLYDKVSEQMPLVGIEPSAILTFRDEYTEFFKPGSEYHTKAKNIANNCYTIEEFLLKEYKAGHIAADAFTKDKMHIRFHAHCYTKALSDSSFTKQILEIPENYTAEEIPSGCCGMAGAFGFEKEHYKLSTQVANLHLLPEIQKTEKHIQIVAAGTSCRHQIRELSGRKALHPAEVLFYALK